MNVSSLPLPLEFKNNENPFTVYIPLKKGCFAEIDAIDGDLIKYRWYARGTREDRVYVWRGYGEYTKGQQKKLVLHRVIMERIIGRSLTKAEEVDHIDRNPLNNRRSNLRIATHAENLRNRGKNRNNTSGYKGVTWDKGEGKWSASITVNYKRVHLGRYSNPEDAYAAYCKAVKEYHGEFSCLD